MKMLLDGKKVRNQILADIKTRIQKEKINALLAIIFVGDNPASEIYIRNKIKACEEVGIEARHFSLKNDASEDAVQELIEKLNKDPKITGIILQSPLPKHLDFDACVNKIKSTKDVDGLTKENIYNLYMKKDALIPCTVKGILRLLEAYKIPISGKHAIIIGRGNIVGHPLSLALTNMDATVTLAHSKTNNLKRLCQEADIIIACAGSPGLIKADMVKENAIVIDVGVTRKEGKIIGDVCFDELAQKASYITPNPGGVGPMTVAMIIENTLIAYEKGSKGNG